MVVASVVVVSLPVSQRTGQQQARVDNASGHRQHRRAGPQAGLQALDHRSQRGRSQLVGAAHEHQVGGLELIGEQILDGADVVEAGVGLALGLQGPCIAHHMARGKGFAIHHRDHRLDAGAGADLGPAEGGHQRLRQGQAAGFHHDAVELVGPLQQAGDRGQKLILHRAAEAAVGQFDQPVLQLAGLTKAACGQEIAIDPDLAEFIDQHRQALAALQQQVTQQGGLAGSEETGHDRDRQPGEGGRGHQPTRADQVQAAPQPRSTAARVRSVVAEMLAAV